MAAVGVGGESSHWDVATRRNGRCRCRIYTPSKGLFRSVSVYHRYFEGTCADLEERGIRRRRRVGIGETSYGCKSIASHRSNRFDFLKEAIVAWLLFFALYFNVSKSPLYFKNKKACPSRQPSYVVANGYAITTTTARITTTAIAKPVSVAMIKSL